MRFVANTVAAFLAIAPLALAETQSELIERGSLIYQASCADCHGKTGEGVEGAYEEPLQGDLSTGQLTDVVATTMPEGDPQACVGEDAEAVAAFMHFQFYSEAARIRNRPPRVMLARLTATQMRQSLADLYSQFDWRIKPSGNAGLNGEYFNDEHKKKDKRVLERIDPQVSFDFGHESPVEGVDPKEFNIYWRGGIVPDFSGEYEIVIRSTCSFVSHLGRYDTMFIDNHVQSGDKTEFRKSIYLTAGRVYPFDLEFIQRERKTESPPASVSLSWVPPGGAEQLIPARNLISDWSPDVFAPQTEFPADDRSYGFERGVAINRQWDEATTLAAIEFAQAAYNDLWKDYRRAHKDEPNENRELLKKFVGQIVERAFRQPLTDEMRAIYVDRQMDAEADDGEAVKRTLLLALKSPRFLYPTLDMSVSGSERAVNRLSLVLFDSLPTEDWLIEAGRKGELENEDSIRAFAIECAKSDYRLQAKTRQMFAEWLNISQQHDIEKSPEDFPEFSPELENDLRQSLTSFVDHLVWNGSGDYRELFQARWTFGTRRIAEVYGEDWMPKEESSFFGITEESDQHAFGLLTHPYMMSRLAYYDSTSPIHRGVYLIRYLLGRTLRPPQEAFSPLSPDLHPDLTTRERVALQTSPDSCQVCHSRINALGFVLENYDAIGRYRETEREKQIDSNGSYIDRDGNSVTFANPAELASYLAESEEAHQAFVRRAFQHFVKQPPAAYGVDTLERLTDKFRENFNIRDLIVEIAVVAAMGPEELDAADQAAKPEPTETDIAS